MAEPRAWTGLLAEFAGPDALVEAVGTLRAAGWRQMEAYTPFPVEGLAERMGFRESWVPAAFLIGGVLGAAGGFALQALINLGFPLDIGGRPVVAGQAFVLIAFELAVLGAVLAGIGTMLVRNRLPRLHHPLFDVERFHLASDDRFFLALFSGPRTDVAAARKALKALKPVSLTELVG